MSAENGTGQQTSRGVRREYAAAVRDLAALLQGGAPDDEIEMHILVALSLNTGDPEDAVVGAFLRGLLEWLRQDDKDKQEREVLFSAAQFVLDYDFVAALRRFTYIRPLEQVYYQVWHGFVKGWKGEDVLEPLPEAGLALLLAQLDGLLREQVEEATSKKEAASSQKQTEEWFAYLYDLLQIRTGLREACEGHYKAVEMSGEAAGEYFTRKQKDYEALRTLVSQMKEKYPHNQPPRTLAVPGAEVLERFDIALALLDKILGEFVGSGAEGRKDDLWSLLVRQDPWKNDDYHHLIMEEEAGKSPAKAAGQGRPRMAKEAAAAGKTGQDGPVEPAGRKTEARPPVVVPHPRILPAVPEMPPARAREPRPEDAPDWLAELTMADKTMAAKISPEPPTIAELPQPAAPPQSEPAPQGIGPIPPSLPAADIGIPRPLEEAFGAPVPLTQTPAPRETPKAGFVEENPDPKVYTWPGEFQLVYRDLINGRRVNLQRAAQISVPRNADGAAIQGVSRLAQAQNYLFEGLAREAQQVFEGIDLRDLAPLEQLKRYAGRLKELITLQINLYNGESIKLKDYARSELIDLFEQHNKSLADAKAKWDEVRRWFESAEFSPLEVPPKIDERLVWFAAWFAEVHWNLQMMNRAQNQAREGKFEDALRNIGLLQAPGKAVYFPLINRSVRRLPRWYEAELKTWNERQKSLTATPAPAVYAEQAPDAQLTAAWPQEIRAAYRDLINGHRVNLEKATQISLSRQEDAKLIQQIVVLAQVQNFLFDGLTNEARITTGRIERRTISGSEQVYQYYDALKSLISLQARMQNGDTVELKGFRSSELVELFERHNASLAEVKARWGDVREWFGSEAYYPLEVPPVIGKQLNWFQVWFGDVLDNIQALKQGQSLAREGKFGEARRTLETLQARGKDLHWPLLNQTVARIPRWYEIDYKSWANQHQGAARPQKSPPGERKSIPWWLSMILVVLVGVIAFGIFIYLQQINPPNSQEQLSIPTPTIAILEETNAEYCEKLGLLYRDAQWGALKSAVEANSGVYSCADQGLDVQAYYQESLDKLICYTLDREKSDAVVVEMVDEYRAKGSQGVSACPVIGDIDTYYLSALKREAQRYWSLREFSNARIRFEKLITASSAEDGQLWEKGVNWMDGCLQRGGEIIVETICAYVDVDQSLQQYLESLPATPADLPESASFTDYTDQIFSQNSLRADKRLREQSSLDLSAVLDSADRKIEGFALTFSVPALPVADYFNAGAWLELQLSQDAIYEFTPNIPPEGQDEDKIVFRRKGDDTNAIILDLRSGEYLSKVYLIYWHDRASGYGYLWAGNCADMACTSLDRASFGLLRVPGLEDPQIKLRVQGNADVVLYKILVLMSGG